MYIYTGESVKSANSGKQAPMLQLIRDEVIIRSLGDRIAPYPSILTSQRILLARIMLKCSYRTETSSLMSEQANQLHNPPVMFNERKITFYTFLHSCDKHAVFFCVWDSLGFKS